MSVGLSTPTSTAQKAWRVRWELPLVVWALAFLSAPIHVFGSGMPQPGDLLMLLAIATIALSYGARIVYPNRLRPFVGFLVGFATWTALVNLAFAFLLSEPLMLIPMTYYAYNGIVTLAMVALFVRHRLSLFMFTSNLALLALAVYGVLALFLFDASSVRQTGLFNNPNQLAYFALLMASLFFAVPRGIQRPAYQESLVVGLTLVLITLSVSRAGLMAAVPLLLRVLGGGRRGILVTLLIIIILLVTQAALPGFSDSLNLRLSHTTSDDERGYERILKFPEYLLLGSGEGANYRWGTQMEFHSTFGVLAHSYGIVGSALFAGLVLQSYRIGGIRYFVPMIPALVYGLTHQGLRFTELWMVIALTTLSAHVDNPTRSATTASAALRILRRVGSKGTTHEPDAAPTSRNPDDMAILPKRR